MASITLQALPGLPSRHCQHSPVNTASITPQAVPAAFCKRVPIDCLGTLPLGRSKGTSTHTMPLEPSRRCERCWSSAPRGKHSHQAAQHTRELLFPAGLDTLAAWECCGTAQAGLNELHTEVLVGSLTHGSTVGRCSVGLGSMSPKCSDHSTSVHTGPSPVTLLGAIRYPPQRRCTGGIIYYLID